MDYSRKSIIKASLGLLVDDTVLVDKLASSIDKRLNFLDWKPPPDSEFFDFKYKLNQVVQHFKDDGLTIDSYLWAAMIQPPLFTMSPETVIDNIETVLKHFADHNLNCRDYLKAAIKQPPLFFQKPKTIINNVEGVTNHFSTAGLTVETYLQATLRLPRLLGMKPSTIIGNIEDVVDNLACEGLTAERYLQAALKLPPLFGMKSMTIVEHANLVADLYTRGLIDLPAKSKIPTGELSPVLGCMLNNPQLFTLADDNFVLREIHAFATQSRSPRAHLWRPRERVEAELAKVLGHEDRRLPVHKVDRDPSEGANHGPHARNLLLRALIREGLVKGRLK